MSKKLESLLLVIVCLFSFTLTIYAATPKYLTTQSSNSTQITFANTQSTSEDKAFELFFQQNNRYMIKDGEVHVWDLFDDTVAPTLINGRYYVPLRVLAESLDLDVIYNDAENTVSVGTKHTDNRRYINVNIKTFKTTVTIQPDVVREACDMTDRDPYMYKERLMIPVDFFADFFGYKVHYRDNYVFFTGYEYIDEDVCFNAYIPVFNNWGIVKNVYLSESLNDIPIKRAAQIYGQYFIPVEDLPMYGYFYKNYSYSNYNLNVTEPWLYKGMITVEAREYYTPEQYVWKYEDLTYLKPMIGTVSKTVPLLLLNQHNEQIFAEAFKVNDDYLVSLDVLKKFPVRTNLELTKVFNDDYGYKLRSTFSSAPGDYKYLKFAHDYAAKLITYEDTISTKSYLDVVASNYYAVCTGYAQVFKEYCDRAWISCEIVDGDADGPHAWNRVLYNNSYKYVDVCWDDPLSGIRTKYFLITEKQLSKDHTLNNYKANK